MKTKGNIKNKVNIITLGCSKNRVDSEVLLTQLVANKIETVHESLDDANIIIINTCGFIDNAKQESIDTILEYAEHKKKGKIDKLYVTGCLSQRYKEDLEKEIPQVDAYFGTRELPLLLKRLNANYKQELVGERIITTPLHYAYMKISEGCDRPCSFCAIPLMRGNHISKPITQLVSEAKNLAKNGVKELLIIAQDSTYYGLDLSKKRQLAELLKHLGDVEGIEWVRIHYAFPTGFPMDIIEVMREKNNICHYLDMPIQHGSTKMLQIMRRGITREKIETLVKNIRQAVPDIAIRTTLIAGHPQETEADFQETLDLIRILRFERLGVFTYSHEENTHSFSLKDDVPEAIKTERVNQIMELQESISMEMNQAKINKIFKVLIDKKENGFFVGRTEFDSPEVDNEVLIDAKKHFVRIGDFVNAKIISADAFDIFAEPCS
ncbi:MAG: 30S ribosomal protein S12 methylthiotransferase RimO [Chitinophagaceae bacterium]|nr:30S ribosomal protein S12 methylthiotransferase RimO [Chitinophagaceae bacterium]